MAEYLTFLIQTVFVIIISFPLEVYIYDFFDIQFEYYINYTLWFRALALFNALLPYKHSNVFEKIL
jgi:hypothetical protein